MNTFSKAFLFDLLKTPSPTGFELPGLKLWAKEAKKYADTVENDAYGNVWATIKGSSKKNLMLEVHADEIGFVVKYVSDQGFVSVDRLGGVDSAIARGRRVIIFGSKGEVRGVIGNTAIHMRDRKNDEKAPEVHELFVDIGAKDAKEVVALGVRVGNPVGYAEHVEEIGKHCIAGRAVDNRLGGFIAIEVLKKISAEKQLPWTLTVVNAVQEEIGGFGARMVTHRIAPDAAICFDLTHATDTPGIKHEQHGKCVLGGGPTVTHGGANHPVIVERLLNLAVKRRIPIQHEAASRFSGTDTNVIYFANGGIPSALVSLPGRYMHSVVEMVDLRDIEKTVELLTAFVVSLKAADTFSVKVVQ